MTTIERVDGGAYSISELVGGERYGYLFTRTYYFYTLREANALFKIAVKKEREGNF